MNINAILFNIIQVIGQTTFGTATKSARKYTLKTGCEYGTNYGLKTAFGFGLKTLCMHTVKGLNGC